MLYGKFLYVFSARRACCPEMSVSDVPIDGRTEVTCPGDTGAIYQRELESNSAGADPGLLAGPSYSY